MKTYFLYFTVFVTGAVVLIIEILGTRVLAPFYGSTIFVWSSLISVTLGFLALGYWLGGKIADRSPSFFYFYALIFLAGASFIFLYQFKRFIILFADNFGLQYGPLIASILLFGATFLFLGMVTPFAIRLRTHLLEKVGTRSGSIFAFSTIGSLVGALVAGFLFIPIFGLNTIFLSVSLALIFLSVIGVSMYDAWRRVFSVKSIILVLVIIFIFLIGYFLKQSEANLTLQKNGVYGSVETVYQDVNFYGDYRVVGLPNARDGGLCLLIDGANQGCVYSSPKAYNYGSPYAVVAFLMENLPPNSDILVLGAGAGEFFYHWERDDLNYDLVDINPKIKEVLEVAGVEIDPLRYNIINDDARSYLLKTDKSYDVIWNDLFGNASPVTHMVTQEAFALMKLHLNPDGLLINNIFGKTDGSDRLVNSVFSTMLETFSYFAAAPTGRDVFFTYIVALGSEQKIDPERLSVEYQAWRPHGDDFWGPKNYYFSSPNLDGNLLTDTYNPAEYLWAQNVSQNETLAGFRAKFKRLNEEDFR